MIQLWLAKNGVKLGVVGIIIAAIFFSGFYVKGRFVKGKILRLNTEIATLQANYDLSLEQNSICLDGLGSLELAIKDQNESIENMARESREALDRANRLREIALANAKKQHDAAMQGIQEEYLDLQERWAVLSASETCHEAWLELIQ